MTLEINFLIHSFSSSMYLLLSRQGLGVKGSSGDGKKHSSKMSNLFIVGKF